MSDDYKIDVASEELISIAGALPKFVQGLVGGKRVHVSTAYRWVLEGVRGRRLPTVRIARKLYTTKGAFSWWVAKLSDDLVQVSQVAEEAEGSPLRGGVEDVLRRAGIKP